MKVEITGGKVIVIDEETGNVFHELEPTDILKVLRGKSVEHLKSTQKINGRYNFLKFFDEAIIKFFEEDISPSEKKLFGYMLRNTEYTTNIVVRRDTFKRPEPLKLKEIYTTLEMNQRTAERTMAKLVKREVVKRITSTEGNFAGKKCYIVNPWVYFRGKDRTANDAWIVFHNSKWAKMK